MKIFWKTVSLMPNAIGHKLIRNNFKFTYELSSDLTFKVAETTDEIEQAFRIIHDGYVESNLIDENEARVRITKYYCLPTTTMLICKEKEEVIATITLIGDSVFGLPTEEFRDISEYRQRGMRLAEISGLTIKKSKQSKRGRLLLPLFKYMFMYAHDYMKMDGLIISTKAKVKEFYRALFYFKALDNDRVVKFSTVKNSETVSQILFVKETPENFRKGYNHLPLEKNIYHYFVHHQFEQFKFPKRNFPFTIKPVFSLKQMQHFFVERTSVLEGLPEKERILLAQHYPHNEFRQIFLKSSTEELVRNDVRVPVDCLAKLGSAFVRVENVSHSGMKIANLGIKCEVNQEFALTVELSERESVSVTAKVMWVRGLTAGLRLMKTCPLWDKMIEEAYGLYRREHELEVA